MNAVVTRSAHQMLDAKPLTRLEAHQHDSLAARCGRYWLVVHTHPQAERWASSNLIRSGFEVYLPTLIVQRRDRHTPTIIHRIETPLFTSYLFVNLDTRDPWTPIRYSTGVRQVLMNSGKPHHLAETVIDALRAGDALRRLPTTDSLVLRPGTPVSCLYGAFHNVEGVIVSAAVNTAKVAMFMFGTMREVVVPIQHLAVRD